VTGVQTCALPILAQHERDRIKQANAPEIERINTHIKELEDAVLAEREACAEIAEKQRYAMHISLTSSPVQNGTAVGIANAIRARGQA
jgi:Mg2+ and Co2+ transporter CorA